MDKRVAFTKLAKDVSKCHVCARMSTRPHCNNGEYLENDDHGLNTDMPYVNLWNLWQGNLDADIMVIGQDFGQKEANENFLQVWKSTTYTNPTDVGLRHLFQTAFSMDIDSGEQLLFFTNMANCYRRYKTTGNMHSGWLPICANKFMGRLIQIVKPKIIIVLGQVAFESMACIDGMTLDCLNPNDFKKNTLESIMQCDYQLTSDDLKIRVFPVYHPGANSKLNRTIEQQEQDWKRIVEDYRRIKNGK